MVKTELIADFEGEILTDEVSRKIYATDASAYREIPQAVAFPKNKNDLKKLILFAAKNKTSLIPRTAGTSLAGQVVGSGIIVDVSRYFTKIVKLDKTGKRVHLEPGVIRDELNQYLAPHNLYFGPETSTANRAMIGGMVGNNSCGSNSVVYGSTREHLISLKGFLSDGQEVEFKALDKEAFEEKCKLPSHNLEGNLYRNIKEILGNEQNRKSISDAYPKPSIPRRNTGYALDLLMDSEIFQNGKNQFNFCKLLAGSEGTLFFITEICLQLVDKPSSNKVLLCAHFNSIKDSLKANLYALKYKPSASELMDHYVLDCTKENIEHKKNRFFVLGDPRAILVIEFTESEIEKAHGKANQLIEDLRKAELGYHFPLVSGEDTTKVWNLRKAGLGLLSNLPGDAKPVPVIEDTAVDVNDLPDYIEDFNEILKKYNLYCVHYAHAGSGELHLRPIINLKTKSGQELFKTILDEISTLVKKYKGSLSGEHGDGRLRGEFIQKMIGEENYQLLRRVKNTWDPQNIFNPGKIVDTPSMISSLRYQAEQETPEIQTYFDFSKNQGILRAAEMCNGSGDCRKTHLSGGTMCPSYMATKNEKDTTRARANILREYLSNSKKDNRFDHNEIKEVLDLCLSCKGCKSECPSNVDMAKMKAEFLQNYYDSNGAGFRVKLFASYDKSNELASVFPGLYNFITQTKPFSSIFKSIAGIAPQRSIPRLHAIKLKSWFEKNKTSINPLKPKKRVWLFADEFSNYNDVNIGIKSILLLTKLGYEVIIPDHMESGRSSISKGFLKNAKSIAEFNVNALADIVSEENPLLGIEPSAIYTFKDEYPDLVDAGIQDKAKKLAENCFMIEEFLAKEMELGNLDLTLFTKENKKILLHGHCHQKAISSTMPSKTILEIPDNYSVEIIPSGCCGMAGSFGYEKEHYHLSQKIAELVLYPAIQKSTENTLIAAPGTSCRHQIIDGTRRKAYHPVEILFNAIEP